MNVQKRIFIVLVAILLILSAFAANELWAGWQHKKVDREYGNDGARINVPTLRR